MFGVVTVFVLTFARLIIPFGLVLLVGSLIERRQVRQA